MSTTALRAKLIISFFVSLALFGSALQPAPVLASDLQGVSELSSLQADTAWNSRPAADDPPPTPTEIPTDTPTDTPTEVPTEAPVSTATPLPTDTPVATEPPTAEPTAEALSVPNQAAGDVSATAVNWYVATTGNDANTCLTTADPCLTINGAIGKAANGDTIYVAVGTYYGSGSEVVTISKSVNISGGWDDTFTEQSGVSIIDGQNARRGIIVDSGISVTVAHFAIQNGKAVQGGGVYVTSGAALTLRDSTVRKNRAENGYPSAGGGIYMNGGALTLNNSTVSENIATSQGGGISESYGQLVLQNATIASNHAWSGGGVWDDASSGTVTLQNSLLANNTSTYAGPDCSGTINTSDYNLIGNTSGCTVTAGAGDQFNVDPQITVHAIGTGYHALLAGSPAIDAGNPATCLLTDQRGLGRPQGSVCDIGAYEYSPPGPAASFGTVSGSGQHTLPGSVFAEPLIVYVVDGLGSPVNDVAVTFTAPDSGPSGLFSDSITTNTTASTDAGGIAIASTFTANNELGSYNVAATASGLPGWVDFTLINTSSWYVSTTGNDTNSCLATGDPCQTINGAIGKAAPGDTILIATGTYTGTGTAVIFLQKAMTISGGWDITFTTQSGFSVIDGQNARRGAYTDGTVTLDHFIIRNGNGGNAGGIDNVGVLTLNSSTVTANTRGGINSRGILTLNNSTVTGNTTTWHGGGVFLDGYGSQLTLIAQNTTIANNSAESGGGLYSNSPYHTITLRNTIVANNSSTTSGPDCAGTISTSDHNIIGNTGGCTATAGAGDQFNVDPQITAYAIGTGYHALLPDSPAIDAGNPATCLTTDQRGVSRPQGGTCDIGAYEYTPPGPAASLGFAGGSPQHTLPNTAFGAPLAAYVVDSQGSPASGFSVSFSAPASGPSGTFADTGDNSDTAITDAGGVAVSSTFTANVELGSYNVTAIAAGLPGSVDFALTNLAWFVTNTGSDANSCTSPAAPCLTINGAIDKADSGDTIFISIGTYTRSPYDIATISKDLTLSGGWDSTFTAQSGFSVLDGQNSSGGVYVTSGGNGTLDRFIIRNVRDSYSYGGGVTLYGRLVLKNSTVSGNTAADDGGGIYLTGGSASLIAENTTIANNKAQRGGGIFDSYSAGGRITLRNSILANNTASGVNPDCFGTISTSDHNIIGSTSGCTVTAGPGDQFNVNPQITPYLIGAGYHALLPTSPAIDAGNPATCLATDQRGVSRPQGSICDIGAYEYTPAGPAASFGITGGSNQRAPVDTAFAQPLVVYVVDSLGSPVSGVDITFTAPASGPSSTFVDSGNITTTATTDAGGLALASALTANHLVGSYDVVATAFGLPGTLNFALTNVAWFVATTGADSNSCALPAAPCRTINAAIGKAASGDIIFVATGTYAGGVSLSKHLTLSGGWDSTFATQSGSSVVDGQNTYVGVAVSYGANTVIDRFTIRNGNSGSGGGISLAGALTLRNSTVTENTATTHGGGIFVNGWGSLIAENSTIVNNNAAYQGGGLATSTSPRPTIVLRNTILARNTSGSGSPNCWATINTSDHNIFGNTSGCTISAGSGNQFNVNPQITPYLIGSSYYALLAGSPAIDAGNPATCLATDQRGVSRPQGSICDIGAYEYTPPGPAASLGIAGGSPQHAAPNTVFTEPLAVYVLDAQGSPVPGLSVSFNAPGSGPTGTFADSGNSNTVAITDAGGIAIASTFTANNELGSYNVTATASGLPTTADFALTNIIWYLASGGSDSNACTSPALPCATINGTIGKAFSGDTLYVAEGDYASATINKSIVMAGGWDSAFNTQAGYSATTGILADNNSTEKSTVSIDRFIVRNGTGIDTREDLTITNCEVYDNQSQGGIRSSLGNLVVRYCRIHDNSTGGEGGGISNFGGTATIVDSQIYRNMTTTSGSGGGVINLHADMWIDNTLIYGNLSSTSAGGIYSSYGALTINNSALYDNRATTDGGGLYGGYGGSPAITNTTLSNNLAANGGGASLNGGGTLTNVTIANNHATQEAGGILGGGFVITLKNSIMSNNTAIEYPSCFANFQIVGKIIIYPSGGCASSNPATIIAPDPQLGPLIPGLGYQPLAATSPAINQVALNTCPATDQRGVNRAGLCDLGAYEYQAPGNAAKLTPSAGSPQRAAPGQAFSTRLQVVALDQNGSPVPGVPVTFTAPGVSPSGTFADTGSSVSRTTDATGYATAPVFTADNQPGDYAVIATAGGISTPAEFNLSNGFWSVAQPSDGGSDSNSCLGRFTPCATISAVLSKPTFYDGDVIRVAGGSYLTPILFTKSAAVSGGWSLTYSNQTGATTLHGFSGIYIEAGANVTLERLSMQDTHIENGGELHILDSTLRNGEGITNNATLTLVRTALTGNVSGGAGALNNYGVATVSNSTISGNRGDSAGGITNNGNFARITISSSTITGNRSTGFGSGGLEAWGDSVILRNTIIVGNTGAGGVAYAPDCRGHMISRNYNLIGNIGPFLSYGKYACDATWGSGDLVGTPTQPIQASAVLDSVVRQDPASGQWVHALKAGSPAIDTGNPIAPGSNSNACPTTDQRGVTRPQGVYCDIGAYEDAQLLLNRSFESDSNGDKIPNSWTGLSLNLSQDGRTSQYFKDLSYSFKMVGAGSNPNKILRQTILKSGVAGDDFLVGLWSKASNVPSGGKYRVTISILNGSTVLLAKSVNFGTGTHNWQLRQTTITAPSAYTKVRVDIYFQKTSGMAWFDLASLSWAP